jgi:hypothetical protein
MQLLYKRQNICDHHLNMHGGIMGTFNPTWEHHVHNLGWFGIDYVGYYLKHERGVFL